ncbi:hypothetical protein [Pseudomonas syringae]
MIETLPTALSAATPPTRRTTARSTGALPGQALARHNNARLH